MCNIWKHSKVQSILLLLKKVKLHLTWCPTGGKERTFPPPRCQRFSVLLISSRRPTSTESPSQVCGMCLYAKWDDHQAGPRFIRTFCSVWPFLRIRFIFSFVQLSFRNTRWVVGFKAHSQHFVDPKGFIVCSWTLKNTTMDLAPKPLTFPTISASDGGPLKINVTYDLGTQQGTIFKRSFALSWEILYMIYW